MTKAEIQQLLKAGYDIAEILEEHSELSYAEVYNVHISPVNYNIDYERLDNADTTDIAQLAKIGRCSYNQAREWRYAKVKEELQNIARGYTARQLATMFNVPEHVIYTMCPKDRYKMTEREWNDLLDRIEDGKITKSEAYRESGASRSTIDRRLCKRLPKTAANASSDTIRGRKPRGRYLKRAVHRH